MPRERLYLPEKMDTDATRKAATTLAMYVSSCTRLTMAEALERILRLLGWLCETKGAECEQA